MTFRTLIQDSLPTFDGEFPLRRPDEQTQNS